MPGLLDMRPRRRLQPPYLAPDDDYEEQPVTGGLLGRAESEMGSRTTTDEVAAPEFTPMLPQGILGPSSIAPSGGGPRHPAAIRLEELRERALELSQPKKVSLLRNILSRVVGGLAGAAGGGKAGGAVRREITGEAGRTREMGRIGEEGGLLQGILREEQATQTAADARRKTESEIKENEAQTGGLLARTENERNLGKFFESGRFDEQAAAAKSQLGELKPEEQALFNSGLLTSKQKRDAAPLQQAVQKIAGDRAIGERAEQSQAASDARQERGIAASDERQARALAAQEKNLEKRLAKMNSSGLLPQQLTKVSGLASQFDSNPVVQRFNQQVNHAASVNEILKGNWSGPGDMGVIYEFMKALDPTSVVRESEYAAASKTGNIFLGWAARFNGVMRPEGGFMSEQVKKDFASVLDRKLNVTNLQVKQMHADFARRINKITGRTDGSDYLSDYSTIFGAQGGGGQGGGTQAPNAQAGPKVGEVQDGYRFKGGNPADQKNWEKVP